MLLCAPHSSSDKITVTMSLRDRIVWYHSPAHASWLNAAEIEIRILSRRAPRRGVGSFQELQHRVSAFECRGNREQATIDWRFTREKARKKFPLPLPGNQCGQIRAVQAHRGRCASL